MQTYCAFSLVLCYVFLIGSCAVDQTYDVYPEATCQHSNNDTKCLTLWDILNEQDKYFTSNVTLVFHEGEHILQEEVVSVSHISSFTLQGYSGSGSGLSPPTITCVNLSNLTQDYSGSGSGLTLSDSGLAFPLFSSSFSFSNVSIVITSIHFNHCSISLYRSVAVVQDSRFENGSSVDGGAMSVLYSSVQFDGANSFTGNMAERYGGAFVADWSTVAFSGSTVFTENKAQTGGAVYCGKDTSFSFSGNTSFMRNTAEQHDGKAVWFYDGEAVCDFGFQRNTAGYGGAVFAEVYNTLSFYGNSSFVSNAAANRGSGVYACDSNDLSFHGSSSFINNTVTAEWYDGGTVYAGSSNTLQFNGRNSFINNTAWNGGAVYAEDENTLSFNGSSSFMSNTVDDYGGAVYAEYGNTFSFSGDSTFVSNTVHYFVGGAVYAWESNTFTFNGRSRFINNVARFQGGAVYAEKSNVLIFDGSSSFMSNTADSEGGAVYTKDNNTLSFSGNNSFMCNAVQRYGGGSVYTWYRNTLNFNGNISFTNNSAKSSGGAVYAWENNTLSFDGQSRFMNNTAGFEGGAVYATSFSAGNTLSFNGSSSFKSNTAHDRGGAVYFERSRFNFHGNSIFVNNEAARGGGIALFLYSHLRLAGRISLLLNTASFGGGVFGQDSNIDSTENIAVIGNEAIHGGGLYVQSTTITLQNTCLLAGNTATNSGSGYGGAILSRSSKVVFKGSFDITNNTADFGGGLAFFGIYDGVLIIKDGTYLTLKGNIAQRRGGAIYVEDDPFTLCTIDSATQDHVGDSCFFQMRDGPYDCFNNDHDLYNRHQAPTTTLKFDNNIAKVSGDIMYGGHLDSCVVCSAYYYTLGTETLHYFTDSETDGLSKLSSNPYKVCICEDTHPNCDLREVNHTAYPGQVLVTSVVAVGQVNGTVPSVIRAISDNLIITSNFKETQPAEYNKQCSHLQYPLFSSIPSTTLKLYSDEPCSTSGYPLTFLINFLPCPVGFTLSEQGVCICDERLQKYTQNCSIQSLTISRDAGENFWVGVEGTDDLILHPHCPFDYCTEEPAYFPLNSTDMQCANGRSGVLCGSCQPGRGIALGSSRCLSDCSNAFLALLMVFAFAGVALVAFLFLCHLTVAKGTLSGLIFYANVLAVNQTVFFPASEGNLLEVFIAWLNLDLGIETCFFVSLDAYYRTWLQFAFPIYIWVMVGVIIVLADRSTAFAKIIGNTNPVAVLATLFLLSYTKLLRAIMAVFSFTTLDYPDGDSKYVWLYDGNVGYLDRYDGRHITLFLFSLLFLLFIFLPYTLLLLCGQWIQKQLWWLSTTKQLYLKFFLDAHYGPYKNGHCYMTGLLLLLRFLMLFVATIININNPQDPHSNLLVILVVSSSLILWGWGVRGFYKKWYHDALEASFIFNLVVLAGATYQVRQSGGNQAALVYTSVSIAFVTFLGIVISAVMPHLKGKISDLRSTAMRNRFMRNAQNQIDEENSISTATCIPMATVTYSVVEISHKESGKAKFEHETESIASETADQ